MKIVLTEKGLAELKEEPEAWKIPVKPKKKVRRKQIISGDDSELGKHLEVEKSTVIAVKQNKVQIPKNIAQQYSAYDQEPQDKGKLDANLPYLTDRHSLMLGEIIPSQAVKKLKNELVSDEKIKRKNYIISSSDFRTNYKKKPLSQKLTGLLSKEVDSNERSLIKYLQSKQEIGHSFLRKINKERNHKQAKKLNKICQMTIFNKNKEEKFKETLKRKLEFRKRADLAEYQRTIQSFEKAFSKGEHILEKYKKKSLKHDIYTTKHSEISRRYWSGKGLRQLEQTRNHSQFRANTTGKLF